MCAFDLEEGKGKGILKVVAGSVAGVGTVAALPVFGAVGTVTLVGAALGAVLGGSAGAFAAKISKSLYYAG